VSSEAEVPRRSVRAASSRASRRSPSPSASARAIRACGANGEHAAEELETTGWPSVSTSRAIVDEFVDIHHQEQKLKQRPVALAFPGGFGEQRRFAQRVRRMTRLWFSVRLE
jgi:hypothetical protein